MQKVTIKYTAMPELKPQESFDFLDDEDIDLTGSEEESQNSDCEGNTPPHSDKQYKSDEENENVPNLDKKTEDKHVQHEMTRSDDEEFYSDFEYTSRTSGINTTKKRKSYAKGKETAKKKQVRSATIIKLNSKMQAVKTDVDPIPISQKIGPSTQRLTRSGRPARSSTKYNQRKIAGGTNTTNGTARTRHTDVTNGAGTSNRASTSNGASTSNDDYFLKRGDIVMAKWDDDDCYYRAHLVNEEIPSVWTVIFEDGHVTQAHEDDIVKIDFLPVDTKVFVYNAHKKYTQGTIVSHYLTNYFVKHANGRCKSYEMQYVVLNEEAATKLKSKLGG